MQIQVNTDSNIDGSEKLVRHLEEEIASTLESFSDQIVSIEAHLSDQNAGKADRATSDACSRLVQPVGSRSR
ncbi:hypothetical protein ACIBEK_34440 [Nocardia fusca]|uniref:hypothetical protein n=1 Tax=Nocardia fusca TaxID=941183 RepID=UPI003794C1D6